MPIPTFLSHSTKDLEMAEEIKHALEFCGFEVFLAHKDLKVSAESEREIMHHAKRCKVFVALLTKHFMKSQWTNQEAGLALGHNAIIGSIKVDVKAPGFLASRQYERLDKEGHTRRRINRACSKIVGSLASRYRRLTKEIRSALVSSAQHSDSYYAAETILLALERMPRPTPRQINAVVRGARNSDQVLNAHIAAGPLRRLVATYENMLDPVELNELRRVFRGMNYPSSSHFT